MTQQDSHQDRLQAVHDALLEEMATIQKNLPRDVEDISESFERYARIIALLVRSLEALLRLDKQQQAKQGVGGGNNASEDILTDIEHRLARIAKQAGQESIPEITEP